MTARRVVIAGRVQGVGYRDWMVAAAGRLGVSGWVRNRRDGTIEALVDGEMSAVEELLHACRRGPRAAEVASITEELADPPDEPGFVRRPTV
jgi:acylphosphatase